MQNRSTGRLFAGFIAIGLLSSIAFVPSCGGESTGSTGTSGGPPDASTASTDASSGATSFGVAGKVAGLAGSGLVITNGSEELAVSNGATTFAFARKLANGAAYDVKIKSQPTGPNQTCTVAAGAGTIAGADVTNVAIACTTTTYKVCATVTGLETPSSDAGVPDGGSGSLLLANGSDLLPVTTNGQHCFSQPVASGAAFAVAISQNPTYPSHVCTVTGGTGTITSGDVTSIAVNCSVTSHAIGGTVTFLADTVVLSLKDEGGNEVQTATVNANGAWAFPTPVKSGTAFSVDVKTQPAAGTCIMGANASGVVAATDASNVVVACNTPLTFDANGAEQSYTIPAGVTAVAIEALGAQGATGGAPAGGAGGLGASATGKLTVAAGDVLSIFVGGAGNGAAGGFNGGGTGGSSTGGGGGGASDVRLGGNGLANRVIVAGGGGGGGATGCETAWQGGAGGAGGGVAGSDGASSPNNGGGGFGGTVNTGGAAGIGCGGFLGTAGTVSNGGAGQTCCCYSAPRIPGGGGGGGGFVAGGGGGGGSAGTSGCNGNDKGAGGGGAGGSSYVGGVQNGVTADGVRSGAGRVRILVPAL